jgi:diaminobutyrate-2-oxoglutarate transaminase
MSDSAIVRPRVGTPPARKLESDVRVYSRLFPTRFRSAMGALVVDTHGHEYIDFFAGAGALNYGHNHPALTARLIDYISSNGIIHSLDMDTEARAEWLERLHQIVLRPRSLDYLVQFTGPTGTNCVEAALKLARKVTGRSTVVAFTRAFHGVSLGALAATASAGARASFSASLHGVVRMPYDGYLGGGDAELTWLEAMLRGAGSGIEAPAAFIFECVQGEGGLAAATPRWARRICEIARELGALVIVDEIQTGCGRTGDFFGFEALAITPDLVCLSKSLSGIGVPLAVLLLRPELDAWCPGEHNGTFRGVNLAFAAGSEALEVWRAASFQEQLARNAAVLRERLTDVARRAGRGTCVVRGRGMLMGLAFEHAAAAHAARARAFRLGLLLENCGPDDEVCKASPPLNIPADLLHLGLDRLEDAVRFAMEATRAGDASESSRRTVV